MHSSCACADVHALKPWCRARHLCGPALVRFASSKILVQTQWEAVRFDSVKHTAGTLLEVFSAGKEERALLAPSASVAPSHSEQQQTEEVGRPR